MWRSSPTVSTADVVTVTIGLGSDHPYGDFPVNMLRFYGQNGKLTNYTYMLSPAGGTSNTITEINIINPLYIRLSFPFVDSKYTIKLETYNGSTWIEKVITYGTGNAEGVHNTLLSFISTGCYFYMSAGHSTVSVPSSLTVSYVKIISRQNDYTSPAL